MFCRGKARPGDPRLSEGLKGRAEGCGGRTWGRGQVPKGESACEMEKLVAGCCFFPEAVSVCNEDAFFLICT